MKNNQYIIFVKSLDSKNNEEILDDKTFRSKVTKYECKRFPPLTRGYMWFTNRYNLHFLEKVISFC